MASTSSLEYRRARSRSRAMRAPTTSWWWNDTPLGPMERVLGLPTSCRSAAIRTVRSGDGLGHHRDGVGQHVLVAVDRVLLHPHGRELGEEQVGDARCPRGTTGPGLGSSTTSSLQSSSRMRSADTISRRSTRLRTAATSGSVGRQPVAGEEAGGPQHAQRVVGEGHLRGQRRAQHAGGEVGHPAERVDQLRRLVRRPR